MSVSIKILATRTGSAAILTVNYPKEKRISENICLNVKHKMQSQMKQLTKNYVFQSINDFCKR